jgi:phospholipid transport system transporter-binding protein
MTLPGAAELLAEGSAVLASAETVFDLATVTDVDSSSIAVIFGWLRAAQQQGKSVRIAHPPQELLSLADVYGVTELLPLT